MENDEAGHDAPSTRPRRRQDTKPASVIARRYRIVRLLGQGGFGRVFEAIDLRLDRAVALKLFDAHLPGDFEREARALAKLRHANVVTVFDVVSDETHRGLTMELVRGGSLAALLARGAVEWPRAARLGGDIASGLHHAHERRIVHGDVKPGNVLIDDGVAKVSDFGTARILESGTSRSSDFEGTVAYAAPEVLEGRRPTIASDLYSLGCVLLDSLSGRPVDRETLDDASALSRRLDDVRPAVPEAMRAIVLRCLAPRRDDRPQDAGAVALTLRALIGEESAPPRIPADLRADLVPSAASGERRRLVALSIARRHLDDLAEDAGSEAVEAAIVRHDATILEQARRHGAFVEALGRDDVHLVFGVARRGEADVDRAIACAFAIGDVTSAPIAAACAIHLVGALSAGPSRPWSLQAGGLRELADVLREAADGEVLVSPAAALACRDVRRLEPSSGTRARRAVRGSSDAGPSTPIFGRRNELGLIASAAEEASESGAMLVSVQGAAGIGKSRLLDEAAATLAREGWLCARVEIQPAPLQGPFHPLRDVLRAVHAHDPKDAALAALSPADVALLRHARGDEGAAASGLSEGELESALRVATRRWIHELSKERPIAWLLDDVHLLDASALEALWSLVEGSRERLLVLVTHRPGLTPPWAEASRHRAVALSALPSRHVRELAASILGTDDAQSLAMILERSEGHPLLAIELARVVAERGAEAQADWPATLQAAVAERLDQLPPDSRLLLQAGATIGREFDLDLASKVLEQDGLTAAPDVLAEAPARRQLIELSWRGAERIARFHHVLIRDTVYEQLIRARRRELHSRVADALIAREPESHDVIAHHCEEAGRVDEAISLYCTSASSLLAGGRRRAAALRYESALRLAARGDDRPSARLDILLPLSALQADLGGVAASRETAREALALAERLGDPVLVARACLRASNAERLNREIDGAISVARRGFLLAFDLNEPGLTCELLLSEALALTVQGNLSDAEDALTRAEALAVPTLSSKLTSQRAQLFFALGKPLEALALIDAQLGRATESDDEAEVARLSSQRGAVLSTLGRLSEARVAAESALAMARKTGNRAIESYSLSLAAHLSLQGQAPLDALSHAESAANLAGELRDTARGLVASLTLAQALHDTGRLLEAREEAARALATSRQARAGRIETGLLLVSARIENTLGEWDLAEMAARAALGRASTQRDPLRASEARVLLAEALRGQARWDESERELDLAEGRHGWLVAERCRLHLARGDRTRAAEELARGADEDIGGAMDLLLKGLVADPSDEALRLLRRALESATASGLVDVAIHASAALEDRGSGTGDYDARVADAARKIPPSSLASWQARLASLRGRITRP